MVSIILAVYNGEKYISEAIESVLNQTYSNFELIIINDGSSDQTEKVINRFSDSRINYYCIQHSGLSDALNYGINRSEGELIARIDADDLWMPEKLTKQISFLNSNPDIDLLAVGKQIIDSRGEIKRRCIPEGDLNNLQLNENLLRYNIICHSSIIFKRSIVKDCGLYDTQFKNCMDYDYWIRILRDHKGYLIGEPLVKYRINPDMLTITKRTQQNLEIIKIKLQLIKKNQLKLRHIRFLLFDVYRLLIPDFLIKLKKRFSKSFIL